MGENKNWSIYIHRNIINNKAYIGITSMTPQSRWGNDGVNYLKKDNRVFAKAIKKYGWDKFEHIIWADGLSEDDAKLWEVRLIALFQTNVCKWGKKAMGYNMTDGGEGTVGYTHTQEFKNKMSIVHTGKHVDDKTRKKISQSTIGKKKTEETKYKISNAKKGIAPSEQCIEALRRATTGKPLSEERRHKISKALKGKKVSDETREKISKSRLGIVFSDEHKEKLRQASLGHKLSDEHKEKLLKAHLGKRLSNETKQKMSDAQKGKRVGKDNPRSKSIDQYDKNGEFIRTWDSIQLAAKSLGLYASSISNCCIGNLKSTGGFVFKYSSIDHNTTQNDCEVVV